MESRRGKCSDCIKKIFSIKHDFTDKDFLVGKEKGREIYFSPVGNQFYFGKYSNGKTPKVVIMGISTSPTAFENFRKDIKTLIDGNDDFDKAFRRACVFNIFNSDKPTLRHRLNSILNLAEVYKVLNISRINLYQPSLQDFVDYKADTETRILLNEVYFSQAIQCASCKSLKNSGAPKLKDIGELQSICLREQIEFLNSFNDKIELMIGFGDALKLLERYDDNRVLEKVNKRKIIKISHPATALGWNMIKHMGRQRDEYYSYIDNNCQDIPGKNRKGYRTACKNCYDQIQKIKKTVREIVEE